MNQADLELEFLIDFPLPRLRFRWGRLGSTRTRAEDTRFLFGITYLDHNSVFRSIQPPVSLIPAGGDRVKVPVELRPSIAFASISRPARLPIHPSAFILSPLPRRYSKSPHSGSRCRETRSSRTPPLRRCFESATNHAGNGR